MRRIERYTNIDELAVNKKEERAVKAFWLGFIIYTAASTLGASTPGTSPVYPAIQIIGLVFLIPAAARLIRFRIENSTLRLLYYVYIAWMVIVVVRGLPFDFTNIKKMLFDAWFGMFLYFVPLVLLFPKNITYLRKVFDVIIVLGLIFLVYVVAYRGFLLSPDTENITSQQMVEFFSKNLSLPAGFLLLTYVYHSNTRRWFAVFVILVTFFFAILRARRGLSFMAISSFVFAFVIYFYANRGKLINIFYAVILVGLLGLYGFKVYSGENKNPLFSLIMERAEEDTRSGVEEYFYKDMTTKDWIIGKGVNGEYFCPGIDEDGFSNYRDTMETDYLNIILKGGIISLGLLLLIAIPAMFKGIFRSKNVISKAAGIWIFLWLINLYPSNVAIFNLNYLLVWICIGICYSPTIRNMPENSVKDILTKGPKMDLL